MVSVLSCYLSDENGVPLDPLLPGSINCEELTPEDRPDRTIVFPNGSVGTLQEVTILIEGYVTIVLDNGTRDTESFSATKQILLCAPNGTEVNCSLTEFLLLLPSS